MAFQVPTTIEHVLRGIQSRKYVLPAIQREFVWGRDQICTLVDSLLRGYPIGSFLFWQVDPETAQKYVFYDFIRDYHELSAPFAPKYSPPPGHGTTAILDGQQRLTSLNMALYGSHAERLPRRRKNNPENYPVTRLHLALDAKRRDEDLGLEYDLRFMTTGEAKPADGEPDRWFPINNILKLENAGPAMFDVVRSRGLVDTEAFEILNELYEAVRTTPVVNHYLEESQDADKVLDIFVRVNSAGTTLSYSDLLLSMATNQWQHLDARHEVRSLVDDVNDVGHGFGFAKDRLLKAGLVLIDSPSVTFQVSNFTSENMARLESQWDSVRTSIMTAVRLLHSFGFSDRNLTADSVITPLAYYIHHRDLSASYVEGHGHAADREQVRQWLVRSLVKRGVWGSGLDGLLMRLREVIRKHGADGFPRQQMEAAMASLGKSLTLDRAEIDDLLDLKYGARRTFPVLSLLYPGLDLTQQFHEDHVFPKSQFTRTRLRAADVQEDALDDFIDRVNLLPNLQLLPGVQNMEKSDRSPGQWIDETDFGTAEGKHQYLERNDLIGLQLGTTDFLEFFDQRRERLRQRLLRVLGGADASANLEPKAVQGATIDEPKAPEIGETALNPETANAYRERVEADSRTHHGVTIEDLLQAGLLMPDEPLIPVRIPFTETVIVGADGTITVDGNPRPSLSAAGRAVNRGIETNGWIHFGVRRDSHNRTMHDLRAEWEQKYRIAGPPSDA